jgi:hypothetical protein
LAMTYSAVSVSTIDRSIYARRDQRVLGGDV